MPEASGWIPLPVYNTDKCPNLAREHASTELWNREINQDCAKVKVETFKKL